MTCKCGHIKLHHQYQRDTQSKTGKCDLVEIMNSGKRKPCWCTSYQNTVEVLGTEGKN